MRKAISLVFILLIVFGMCSCGTQKGEEITQDTAQEGQANVESAPAPKDDATLEDEDESFSDLEALGKVQVENGLLYVTVTIPSDLAGEEITQDELDANKGDHYTSATLNEDGSVTYKMTKKQHKAMVNDLHIQFDKAIEDLINDDTYNIDSVSHNSAYTEFDITLSTESLGLTDSFSVLLFYLYGGICEIFTGKTEDVVVNFYGPDGALIESANSSNLNQ